MSRLQRALSGLTERIAPKVPDFHGLLESQCAVVEEALDALVEFARTGSADAGRRVRELEKEGDRRRALTLSTLARAFATPFDRGSIHLAATAIDDILNYAKTTVREVEMLGVPPDRWMIQLAEELQSGAASLHDGFARLRTDPQGAQTAALAVHKAERNTEKIYRAAVAEAFAPEPYVAVLKAEGVDGVAPVMERLLEALRRREIYRHLSNAADRLDGGGRALLDIVLEGE